MVIVIVACVVGIVILFVTPLTVGIVWFVSKRGDVEVLMEEHQRETDRLFNKHSKPTETFFAEDSGPDYG